jgi:hypothetical protein
LYPDQKQVQQIVLSKTLDNKARQNQVPNDNKEIPTKYLTIGGAVILIAIVLIVQSLDTNDKVPTTIVNKKIELKSQSLTSSTPLISETQRTNVLETKKNLLAAENLKKEEEEKLSAQTEKQNKNAKKLADEKIKAEALEAKKLVEEKRLAQIKQAADEKQAAKEKKVADQKKIAEDKRVAKEKQLAEDKIIAKEKQVAEEKRVAKDRKIADEKARAVKEVEVIKEDKLITIRRPNRKELRFSKVRGKLFSIGEDFSGDKTSPFLPSNIKNAIREGEQNVFVNAYKGDTWITYKSDGNPIKKFVLKQSRTLLIRGEELRILIGNVDAATVFYNNKELILKSKSGVKSLVFPEDHTDKFHLPLFVYENGKAIASDEFIDDLD